MRPVRRPPIAIFAVGVGLALAGCGDEDSDSQDSASPATEAETLPGTAEPATETGETTADEAGAFCGGLTAGLGAVIVNIRATNVGCKPARQIAAGWQRMCEGKTCRVIGFDCSPEVLGPEEMEVTCRREGATVRFFYGV